MKARLFASATLCAGAFALMTTVGAVESVPLSAPKPLNQNGFPAQLYSWVIPADNPQTPAKVELGRKLFFDDRISADGTVSCDQCHAPAKGFTDQLPASMGIHHAFGQRNAPTVLNALLTHSSSGTAAPRRWRSKPKARLLTRSRWATRAWTKWSPK